MRHEPTPEHVARLSGSWTASYSGGKDSTTLVTWVEYLRRSGQIVAPNPGLVMSDTGVEDPALIAIAESMRGRLAASGWDCVVVEPLIHERLYNRIMGIGVSPTHPGNRKMRWCTRSTKIDPMERHRKAHGGELVLTGLRLGESAARDAKIRARGGCQAGGECGMPEPGRNVYSPLLDWTLCNVIDWLAGNVDPIVNDILSDLIPITRQLLAIYEVESEHPAWPWGEIDVKAARFGCIGCPAISAKSSPPASVVKRNGGWDSPLNELYDVWMEARARKNRCFRGDGYGPIKLAVRPRLLDRVLSIQARAKVVLVRPEDLTWIEQCWREKRYPRGWSEADEIASPACERERTLFPAGD